jgi:hypothetical protein
VITYGRIWLSANGRQVSSGTVRSLVCQSLPSVCQMVFHRERQVKFFEKKWRLETAPPMRLLPNYLVVARRFTGLQSSSGLDSGGRPPG